MLKKKITSIICTLLMLSVSAGSLVSYAADWDLTLPSLYEAYSEYFTFGNIMEPSQAANEATTKMFKYHYNVVTAENAMKPVNLTNAKGNYIFSNADQLVNWALENDIAVHGHTLVWHSQSAKWLTMDSNSKVLTRAEAKENLEEYINTVAGHYAGKVISWDVVNEAFLTGVSAFPIDWRDALRKYEINNEGSTWYQAYANGADAEKGESGADYIYDAYVLARLADPNAILYYNDYNETMTGKREAIAMMVEELNAQWKNDERNTESDRLLIEGIGMQAHYWTSDLNISEVEKSLERFIKTGCEISVSELDIPHGKWNTFKDRTTAPTEEEEQQQADFYSKLFKLYKKYSDYITRVTIWGKIDSQSWRREGYPALFDKDLQPKKAYYSIIEMAEQKVVKVDETMPPKETEAPVTEETPDITTTADTLKTETNENNSFIPIVIIIAAVIAIGAAVTVLISKRKK